MADIHICRLSSISCIFIQEPIAICLLDFVFRFRDHVANFEVMHKSGCACATLLKDGDLKLKEVREKIMGENCKSKFQFLISRHCSIRKLRSHDEFLGHRLIRK